MKCCTFFGHRYVFDKIEQILTSLLIKLIENDVKVFYVGSQGDFDCIVIKTLKSLKNKYPHISYYTVLAYLPVSKDNYYTDYSENTLYPDGLEFVPQKYAIIKRNQWMIEKSDYVIVYVKDSFGNAVKFKELSQKKGKTVINIVDFI